MAAVGDNAKKEEKGEKHLRGREVRLKPRGVWFLEEGTVLSEVLRDPGATGSIFDVLAATVATLCRGSRFALLGFGAGGIVAPLRAIGFDSSIEAVDLSLDGERVFRKTVAFPCEDVRVTKNDAVSWLKRNRRRFDLILDDLSVPHPELEVVKPEGSLSVLPNLVANRLAPSGVAVFNLLPSPGFTWTSLLELFATPFSCARVLVFRELHNRILICGSKLPNAVLLSRDLRSRLRAIRSNQADRFTVRTYR